MAARRATNVTIVHRTTSDPREEPGALAAHAGICAGGGEKSSSLPRPSWTVLQIKAADNANSLPCRSCYFAKCRQRPFNHLIGCRQTDSEVVRRIHHTTGQDEDITIGERVPLPLRIAIRPFAPKVEGTFRRKN